MNADGKNLDYTDEKGDVNKVDLAAVIDAKETLTKLEIKSNDNGTPANTSDDFEELVYTDEDKTENKINIPIEEPWFGTDDNKGATQNTENMYAMGKVGIGTDNPSKKLHVAGDARIEVLPDGYIGDSLVSTDNSGNLRKQAPLDMRIVGTGNHITIGAGKDGGVVKNSIPLTIQRVVIVEEKTDLGISLIQYILIQTSLLLGLMHVESLIKW